MEDQALRARAVRSPVLARWARERFLSHVGLLLVALCGMLGIGVYVGVRVMGVLPDVGKDLHPADSWGGPIAVEHKANGWLVAHVPPCAQGPVAGLVLWDDQNRPLWQLRGEAFPIGDFLVGAVPPGLKVTHKLETPSDDQVLRLGVFRTAGLPVGLTFRIRDLRADSVHYGGKWLTINQFRAAAKCPKPKVVKQPPSTSEPARRP